jgi:hypothetical protein
MNDIKIKTLKYTECELTICEDYPSRSVPDYVDLTYDGKPYLKGFAVLPDNCVEILDIYRYESSKEDDLDWSRSISVGHCTKEEAQSNLNVLSRWFSTFGHLDNLYNIPMSYVQYKLSLIQLVPAPPETSKWKVRYLSEEQYKQFIESRKNNNE